MTNALCNVRVWWRSGERLESGRIRALAHVPGQAFCDWTILVESDADGKLSSHRADGVSTRCPEPAPSPEGPYR